MSAEQIENMNDGKIIALARWYIRRAEDEDRNDILSNMVNTHLSSLDLGYLYLSEARSILLLLVGMTERIRDKVLNEGSDNYSIPIDANDYINASAKTSIAVAKMNDAVDNLRYIFNDLYADVDVPEVVILEEDKKVF